MYLVYYLLAISAGGFLSILSDKIRSIKGWKRIDPRKFGLTCVIGGAPGIWLGIIVLKHPIEGEIINQWVRKLTYFWLLFLVVWLISNYFNI